MKKMRDYPVEYDISDAFVEWHDSMFEHWAFLALKDWCNENMATYLDLMEKLDGPEENVKKYKASVSSEQLKREREIVDRLYEERDSLLADLHESLKEEFYKYYYLRKYSKFSLDVGEVICDLFDDIANGNDDWRYDLDQY